MASGHLRGHFFLMVSTHSVRSGRRRMLQVVSVMECHLRGTKKRVFVLWRLPSGTLFPSSSGSLSLLTFRKALRKLILSLSRGLWMCSWACIIIMLIVLLFFSTAIHIVYNVIVYFYNTNWSTASRPCIWDEQPYKLSG